MGTAGSPLSVLLPPDHCRSEGGRACADAKKAAISTTVPARDYPAAIRGWAESLGYAEAETTLSEMTETKTRALGIETAKFHTLSAWEPQVLAPTISYGTSS
jgi:hypothetical protein